MTIVYKNLQLVAEQISGNQFYMGTPKTTTSVFRVKTGYAQFTQIIWETPDNTLRCFRGKNRLRLFLLLRVGRYDYYGLAVYFAFDVQWVVSQADITNRGATLGCKIGAFNGEIFDQVY